MPDTSRSGTADVLVVGAGPAGSCAATVAARAGLQVVLADAARFPRHRPGETIGQETVESLEQLIGTKLFAVDSLRFQAIQRSGSLGHQVSLASGLHIRREVLDAVLVDTARAAGADVRLSRPCARPIRSGAGWNISVGREDMAATFLIDASGSARWLQRALDIADLALSINLIARYWYGPRRNEENSPHFELDERGWTWMSPVSGDSEVTCEMVWPGTSEPVRGRGALMRDVSWRVAGELAGHDFARAGDSAGQIDPSSANGIQRAVLSGIGAGNLAVHRCRGGAPDEPTLNYCRSVTTKILRDCATLHQAYETHSGRVDPVGFALLAEQFLKGNHGSSACG